MGARHYSPEIGRFISEDPVKGSAMAPQTMNPYSYVINNPLKYVDPTGEIPVIPIIIIAMTVIMASLATTGEVCDGIHCSNMNADERFRLNMDLLSIGVFDVVSDAFYVGDYASRGDWGGAGASALIMAVPVVSMGMVKQSAKSVKALKWTDEAEELGNPGSYIRYMTKDEYKHLKRTGELNFGKGGVYATTDELFTDTGTLIRGGIPEPKRYAVKFKPVQDTFEDTGGAVYPRQMKGLANQKIPGGITEYYSELPVKVKIEEVWPLL